VLAPLGVGFAIACPAFPLHAHSVYAAYRFVGGVGLDESGMESHPFTPMRDAKPVRVRSLRTNSAVGLVVEQGRA
jgi:3-dehydrotetronate 4-kinase